MTFYAETYKEALSALHSPRRCRSIEWLDGMRCRVDGVEAVNFSSNDYLGLSRHPRLMVSAREALEREGAGTGSSRLICGTHPDVMQLENELARFKGTEAALVLNTGYQANVSILQAVLQPGDWVFADKLNHASLVDGCRLSGSRLSRYHHLDLDHLRQKLAKAPADARKWVVTDSVFSMDGDYPDLAQWQAICEEYGAFTLVDEAHATGLFGHGGKGLCDHFGIADRVTLQMGTFSKALGSFGAYVAGSRVMMDYLVNFGRGFIYSTALPPAVIGASRAALAVMREEPEHRERLFENVRLFQSLLPDVARSFESPIVPVIVGDDAAVMTACGRLLEAGWFVQGIRPPTVPPGTARLRVTLTALHTPDQVRGLVEALQRLGLFRQPSLS